MNKLLKWLKSFHLSRKKKAEPKFKHGETISVGNSTGRITEIYEMSNMDGSFKEYEYGFGPKQNGTSIWTVSEKNIIRASGYDDFLDKINDRIK